MLARLAPLALLLGCGAPAPLPSPPPPPRENAPLRIPPLAASPAPASSPFGGETPVELAAADARTCARTREGHLWCWGLDRSARQRVVAQPERLETFSEVQAIAGASGLICVQRPDEVRCLERDIHGTLPPALRGKRFFVERLPCFELGKGSASCLVPDVGFQEGEASPPAPECTVAANRVACGGRSVELRDLQQVVSGASHVCALHGEGKVSCWGSNRYGQLGLGKAPEKVTAPRLIEGITDAVEVRVGAEAVCARRVSGDVMCWGANGHGQLGDGTTTSRGTPAPVRDLAGATSVSIGEATGCALVPGGARCWGRRDLYEHDAALSPWVVPSGVVPGTAGGVQVAAHSWHACARAKDGTVTCWGANDLAQLGAGDRAPHPKPTKVLGLADAVDVALESARACAARRDGTVACWGYHVKGQYTTRAEDVGVSGVARIALVPHGVCAARRDGTAFCAPLPRERDGKTVPLVPLPVSDAAEVAAGNGTVCVLRRSGKVACGADLDEKRPRLEDVLLPGSASQVAAGDHVACAVAAGSVFCWGQDSGQLGTGAPMHSDEPLPVGGAR